MKGALGELADLVRQRTGIVTPATRTDALRAAMRKAAPGTDEAGLLRAVADPAGGRMLLDRLLDELTVQETYFARDIGQLRNIPWIALAAQASHRGAARPLRVWSAGCATGEEAYTLAIEAVAVLGPGRPVDVLGTDISQRALAAAAAGCYRQRSVRELSDSVRLRFLRQLPDGTYQVRDQIRSLVRFARHNLVFDQAPPPGEAAFDVVVCRNVLIYLDTAVVMQATANLERALREGGALVLGATDMLHRAAAEHASGLPRGYGAVSRAPRPRAASTREPEPASAGRPDAELVRGLRALETGDASGAAQVLRRALAADPTLGLAAFALGRACDRLGDSRAAHAAYEQALRTLDPADQRHEMLLQQIDIRDIAAACRARLGGTA